MLLNEVPVSDIGHTNKPISQSIITARPKGALLGLPAGESGEEEEEEEDEIGRTERAWKQL